MLSSPLPGADPLRTFTSAAVFLMGALALVVPTGYSVGAALLLLGSAALLFKRAPYSLGASDRWVILALALYGCVVGGLSVVDLGSSGFDIPMRFLLAIPVLLLIVRFPPRQACLWAGMAVGAGGAGSWALWQKSVIGVERAGGYLHVIQFGNLSMLMGVLCLAGLGWAMVQRYRLAWVIILLAGAFLGMLGSLLSGSRGGWIGLPVVGYVLYRGYGRQLSISVKLAAVGALLAIAVTMYALPQTGVQQRVHAGINDVHQYVSGAERDTSLGLRFEMWRGASSLIRERPLLGWGEAGYQAEMVRLGQQGDITMAATQFGHAHNEFVDAFAKRGMVGLFVLLFLYLVPMRMFASGLQHPHLEVRALALAGTLLPVAYIDFGLSQAFLSHNSGAMFYAFWLAVLWGSYRAYAKAFTEQARSTNDAIASII